MDFYIIYSQDSFIIDTDELTWEWENTPIVTRPHSPISQISKMRLRRGIMQVTYLDLKPGSSAYALSLPESPKPTELQTPLYFFR